MSFFQTHPVNSVFLVLTRQTPLHGHLIEGKSGPNRETVEQHVPKRVGIVWVKRKIWYFDPARIHIIIDDYADPASIGPGFDEDYKRDNDHDQGLRNIDPYNCA